MRTRKHWPEDRVFLQRFPATEKDTSLRLARSASVTMYYHSMGVTAMEGQSATCPSLELLQTEVT